MPHFWNGQLCSSLSVRDQLACSNSWPASKKGPCKYSSQFPPLHFHKELKEDTNGRFRSLRWHCRWSVVLSMKACYVTCFFFRCFKALLLPPWIAVSALVQSFVHTIAPVVIRSCPKVSFTHFSFLPLYPPIASAKRRCKASFISSSTCQKREWKWQIITMVLILPREAQ